MSRTDTLIPFLFERLPVRGALVQLGPAWQRIQGEHGYVDGVRDTLGHAAAASALIAQSLKFDGDITLQMSGEGPLSMLVMQCSSSLELRGMAHADSATPEMDYASLVHGAHCAITVDGPDIERPYQGIVEAGGESLAASLTHYYDRSAQVPSHVALVSDGDVAGGLLLQQMPSADEPDGDDWHRLGLLAATLRTDDLATGIDHELLARLFAEDDLRVFSAREAVFRCRCSQKRTEDVLRMLGPDEAQAAIDESGEVEVTCEYCGRRRRFDAIDLKRLFAAPSGPASGRLH